VAVEPVRIKLYGLFPTTKRRYITQVIIAGVLMALLLGMWLFYWQGVRQDLSEVSSPLLDRVIVFCNSLPYIVLVIAVLQVIEAYFALRAFARAEAAAPAANAPPSPQTPAADAPASPSPPPTQP
jgi:hypothetical protein